MPLATAEIPQITGPPPLLLRTRTTRTRTQTLSLSRWRWWGRERVPILGPLLMLVLVLVLVQVLLPFSASVPVPQRLWRGCGRGTGHDMAWRLDCASQSTFPAAAAEKRAPALLMVAVVSSSTRLGLERRMAIRQTWAAHGMHRAGPGVVVKFLVPTASSRARARVELERAAFNDVAILPGMGAGPDSGAGIGTDSAPVLEWAQTEAVLPVRDETSGLTRWRLVDYLVKTTDDTFLVLPEIEKRLRLLPRTGVVWGAPAAHEPSTVDTDTWAVSSDLFAASARGVNDILRAGEARLRTETCGVYDHPLSRTVRSHGFITAADVQVIKDEVRYGAGSAVIAARGGATQYLSYSSVVDHMPQWSLPRPWTWSWPWCRSGQWCERSRRRPLQRKASDALAASDPHARVAGLMEGAPPRLAGNGNLSAPLSPSSSPETGTATAACLSEGTTSCHRPRPLVGTRGASTSASGGGGGGGATLAVRRVGGDWFTTSLALLGETWREGSELRMVPP